MFTNTGKVFQKLARLGYTLGMVSMLAAAMLSVINQPVSAYFNSSNTRQTSSEGTQDPGVGSPTEEVNGDSPSLSIQSFGGDHGDDDEDKGTKTPKPTKEPTNTKEPEATKTDRPTKTPSDPESTNTQVPSTATEVPATSTNVPPTETIIPVTGTPTSTEEPTIQVAPSFTPTVTPLTELTFTPTATKGNEQELKLNLSHIVCLNNGSVEIHFVLLNVPDGVTPGTLSYTYGSIAPGAHTGNVWHYTDNKPSGYYNVTSASVSVGGSTVNLHNPGAYEGMYSCGATPTLSTNLTSTPTATPTDLSTNTPTSTATDTPTATLTNTPTDTPTATLTNTPTDTPTATQTNTPTFTPTNVPFLDLKLAWACIQGAQQWTVTNENGFPVDFQWELNNAVVQNLGGAKLASLKKIALFALDSGNGTVPANSALSFFTAGGYHTMTIRWNNGEVQENLSLTTSPTSPCLQQQPTSTPTTIVGQTVTPKSTNTPVSRNTPTNTPVGGNTPTNTPVGGNTLTNTPVGGSTPTKTQVVSSTQTTALRINPTATRLPTIVRTLTPDPAELAMVEPELLIPVTGSDVSGNPFANQSLSTFFLNLGFIFFGLAFTSQGLALKLNKKKTN